MNIHKIFNTNKESKHEMHQLIVVKDYDHCCYISIIADDPEDGMPFLSVGRLTYFPAPDYLRTFSGRLRCMWNSLLGKLWGYDIDLMSRDDCKRFIDALTEAMNYSFPDKKE